MLKYVLAIFLFFNTLYSVNAGPAHSVEYPEGYRNWQHVKSMVIRAGHPLADPFAGIHHIYANKSAIEGLQIGHYENGAVFVFDLFSALDQNHAITEGTRKLIGVMIKDRDKFASTGGWGFEGFAGNSSSERLTADGGQSCYGCHTQRTEQDFIFTTLRD